jgi:hypothetical protein
MSATIHRSSFIKMLRAQLPAVEPWLNGYRDNLTLEMMRFEQFTQDAIGRGDWDTVRRAFQLAHTAFERGNKELRNSLVVTYLEHLELTGVTGEKAKTFLSSDLARERDQVIAYMEKVANKRG